MERIVKVFDIRAGLAQGLNQSEAQKIRGLRQASLWKGEVSRMTLLAETFLCHPVGVSPT